MTANRRGSWWLAAGVVATVAWLVALALANGAYFVTGWGPLSAALVLALVPALAVRGRELLLDRGVLLLAAPLAGIALLAAASMAWTWFSAHRAWLEAGRFGVGALAVLVGAAWFASPRGRGILVAAIAGSVLGIVAALAAWLATAPDDALDVLSFGKAAWPIGNSNAFAVWVLVGIWCCIATTLVDGGPRSSHRRARPVGAAAATIGWAFVLAADSFGSIVAWATACLLLVALGPAGRRLVAWSAGSAAIAWLVVGRAVDALHAAGARATTRFAAGDDVPAATNALRDAAVEFARLSLVAGATGAVAAIAALALAPRVASRLPRRRPRGRTVVLVALVAATVAGVALATTSPGRAVARSAFTCPVPPPPDESGFRAPTDVEYDFRCDYWRVAIDSFVQRPLPGWGADSFHGRYMLDRRGPEQPREPHSLPLQLAGDLGVGGVLLLAAFAWGLVRAHWRTRHDASPLDRCAGAASLAAVATWFAHATLDFTFNVLAITLPVFMLAGAIAARPRPARERAATDPVRGAMLALAVVVAWCVLVVPQVGAATALRRAEDPRVARREAVDQARIASRWDPTWARPHLARAFALLELGRAADASRAALEAERLEPNHWTVRVAAARIHDAADEHGRANRSARQARRLNPQLETGA